jgi:undecaprenyl-diphosphatase
VRELDRALFEWINHWPEALSPVFVFFSEATKSNWVRGILLAFIIALIVYDKKPRKAALLSLVSWPIANELTDVLKNFFQMARPAVDNPIGVIERVGHLTSFGTASAHSANMACVAFVFTYCLGWWGSPWIVVALLTGLSRIYVGVHYPSQVLLGWVCGVFCGLLVVKTWEAFAKLRNKPREDLGDTVDASPSA